MATLLRMLPRLHRIVDSVRATLDSHDRFVTALAGAHRSAASAWSGLPTPTAAQTEANAYTLGMADWQGITLRIENPAHSIREGVGADGKTWRNLLLAHYGEFPGTRGADGDPVDVFLGPAPESRACWILNQRTAGGAFDEVKVLVGFHDERAAIDAYRLSYTPGWDRFDPPIRLSLAQLKWWLKYADTTREFTPDQVPPEQEMPTEKVATPTLNRVFWDSAAMPASGLSLADVLYTIRSNDAREGLVMDAMTMRDIREGAEVLALDALVVQVGRLDPTVKAMMRMMEAAGGAVSPVAVQISEPLRRYGGVHVAALFELSDGQTMTVWFHNPDSTPTKLTPADDLVSWKWQLNKKDITIVVAPEKGDDLNIREVARRVMRLAEKNSAAFAKANVNRAARMSEIEGLRTTLTEKQGVLAGLQGQIEVAKIEVEDRKNAAASRFVLFRDGNGAVGKPMAFYATRDDAQETLDDSDTDRAGAVYGVDASTRDLFWSFRAETFIKGANEKFADAAELKRVMDAAIRWANKERGEFGFEWIINNMPAWVSLGWRIERATAVQANYFHMGVGDVDEASLYVESVKLAPEPERESKPAPAVDLAKEPEDVKPEPKSALPDVFKDIESDALELLLANATAHAAAAEVQQEVEKNGGEVSWVATSTEPDALVFDGLFELDGAKYVRGDISYKSRPIGSVTVNGTGMVFFTKPDGSAYNPRMEADHDYSDDEYTAERSRLADSEGLLGWTNKIGLMVQYMLNQIERDIIDDEIASKANAAENGADDAEQDGVAWPNTILDKDNPHWKVTLNDAENMAGAGAGKTKRIGMLSKGSQELIASAVYRGKNAAAWYIVLTKPGQRKMLENIPFPSISGINRMGKVAAILMGYLDADEPSGFKIAPPGSMEGAEPVPPVVTPEPTETAEAKFLREVSAGVHDALDLSDMLAKIEASINAMKEASQLAGDNDPVADAAILRWASLEEKANG